jgi:tetratricopeptide (TPR) repeat protein
VAVVVSVAVFWRPASSLVPRRPVPEVRSEPPKPKPEEPAVVMPPAVVDAGVSAEATPDAGEAVIVAAPPLDAGTAPKVKSPPSFDTLLLKADRLREADRPETALEAYQKAIDMKPTRAEPFAGRGLAYLDMGQPGMAEAEFKQALRLDPRYGEAIMGLAETYRALGRKDEAIEYYQLYLEELPKGPEASIAQMQIRRLQE